MFRISFFRSLEEDAANQGVVVQSEGVFPEQFDGFDEALSDVDAFQEPHPEKKIRQVDSVSEENFLRIVTGGAHIIERVDEGVPHLAQTVADRRWPYNGQHEIYTFFYAPHAESLAEILVVIRYAQACCHVEQSPHSQSGVDQKPAQGHTGAVSFPLEDVVRQYERECSGCA